MNDQKEIATENGCTDSGVRDIAKRVLLAAGLSAFSTHCGDAAGQHERLMRLANALLTEAANRGFSHDVELRALLASGLVSARTVDLVTAALEYVSDEGIADVVMKLIRESVSDAY
jgi:hypothetical protein